MNTGLVLALLFLTINAQSFYPTNGEKNTCNPMLLATYDLEEIRQPTKEANFLCPNIEQNCCTSNSQVLIFKKWTLYGERDRLLQVYKTIIATYDVIFEDFKLVEQMALGIVSNLGASQSTNCGIMAKAILASKASSLKKVALDSVRNAYNFIYNARRGFYCSLCDANAHQSYSAMDGAIRTSQGFCANLVKSTLSWSQFNLQQFPQIARLYGHFTAVCDPSGRYDTDKMMKKGLHFLHRRRAINDITKCQSALTAATAAHECYDYCSRFNPAKFNKMFEGGFVRLLSYRVWLNKEINGKLFPQFNFNNKRDLNIGGRILSDAKTAAAPAAAAKVVAAATIQRRSTATPKVLPPPPPLLTPIAEFNIKFGTKLINPVSYSAAEDFRKISRLNYRRSLFKVGPNKFYNIADFRVVLDTSGINFEAYSAMLRLDTKSLDGLNTQIRQQAKKSSLDVTDYKSINFGRRKTSVQIIG